MLLQLKNITKRFPGILANDRITLNVSKGEVHAIVGENGAGKTTLMNILYGLYQPDEGEIIFKGHRVEFSSPKDAIANGIGMVHQHFMLIPPMTVTENVILGVQSFYRKPFTRPFPFETSGINGRQHRWTRIFPTGFLQRTHSFLDIKSAARIIRTLSEQFGLAVNPHARIQDLAVGVRQRVEIIKALYRQAELLILDEPTSVLTPQETTDFFRILHTLVEQGMSVIFITHKLNEVIESSHRATVLRHGNVVAEVNVADVTQRELAQMMVGRGVLECLEKTPHTPGPEVLRIERLCSLSPDHIPVVDHISLSLHAGEILGIAGVSGNGQTELAEILAGLRTAASGKIVINGQDMTNRSPRAMMKAGVSHIPEERQNMGLVMEFPLYENAILGSWFETPFSTNMILNRRQSHQYTQNLIVSYDVKAKDITVAIHELSGGNQQKFLVGRELDRSPRLLLAVQPTRGVDVGSTECIHQKLLEQREQGVAIVLISTELDEIFALSDRIGVMYKGKIVGIMPADETDRETVGLMMAGAREDPKI